MFNYEILKICGQARTHVYSPARFTRCWYCVLFIPSLPVFGGNKCYRYSYLLPLSSSVPLNIIPTFVLVFLLQMKVFKNNICIDMFWNFAKMVLHSISSVTCFLTQLVLEVCPCGCVRMWSICWNCSVFHRNRLPLSQPASSSQDYGNQGCLKHPFPASSWTWKQECQVKGTQSFSCISSVNPHTWLTSDLISTDWCQMLSLLIPLIISVVKHLFICLLANWVSSSGTAYLYSLLIFLLGCCSYTVFWGILVYSGNKSIVSYICFKYLFPVAMDWIVSPQIHVLKP